MMKIALAVAAPTPQLALAQVVFTIGPRQRCHMETTTIERDDGRRITRKERRCD